MPRTSSINNSDKARQATESVFSVADELVLLNFRSIFRTGLDDPALLNATMLTFSFAVTGVIDLECLGYQRQALNSIRVRMSSLDEAASESTLAAILLLAGIEVCPPFPLNSFSRELPLYPKNGAVRS